MFKFYLKESEVANLTSITLLLSKKRLTGAFNLIKGVATSYPDWQMNCRL